MNVIFKNVGQGDSIIIEWEEEGVHKFGLIDCNRSDGKNPILEYVKNRNPSSIEFIFLSHPHEDHYSGFKEVFEFIEEKKIIVKRFGSTYNNVGKPYWKLFEIGVDAGRELEILLTKIIELKKAGIILETEMISKNWKIDLSPNMKIIAISPSEDEVVQYQSQVKLDADINKREASQAANLLSTLFCLSTEKANVLLTSDTMISAFERIHKEKHLEGKQYSLVQVPHHGSIKNYTDIFWKNIDNPKEVKDAVVSSGYNLKYKHPDIEVLNQLETLKYNIHATNIVHGMHDYVELVKKTVTLDMVSDIQLDSFKGGDKVFTY
jgi:beta-lactamase superfamily II metal-dependent hydrolase